MELRLLCILMEAFILTKGHAVICTSGEQIIFLCEAINPHTRWFWFPLDPRCANIRGTSVEIIQNYTTHEVTPLRFNKRIYQTPGSLLLMDLVMSDAGTYICRLPNGSETRNFLQVNPGCHNNLLVTFEWRELSSLQLSCRHCNRLATKGSFRWLLNSKRLGNPWWAKKSDSGSTITIHSIQRVAWGRWECHSLAFPSWVSEICLSPHQEEKGTGTTQFIPKDFPPAKSTSLAASHWLNPPVTKTTEPTGHAIKGTPVWFWIVLLVVLLMAAAAIGAVVWLWKRKQADRKRRENREWADHAFLGNATRKEEGVMRRESLDERPASLHYAQLQHPRRKSTIVQIPDSTTVYAVIV